MVFAIQRIVRVCLDRVRETVAQRVIGRPSEYRGTLTRNVLIDEEIVTIIHSHSLIDTFRTDKSSTDMR